MSIALYTDARSAFCHVFERRQKELQPQMFTVVSWSQEIGIRSSSLADLLKGKRKIRLRHIEILLNSQQIQKSEALFMKLLVQKDSSQNDDEKRFFDELIQRERKNLETSPVESLSKETIREDQSLTSSWLNYVVMNFPFIKNFNHEMKTPHTLLREPVEAKEVSRSIATLKNLGILSEGEDHQLKRHEPVITTRSDISVQGAHEYYNHVFDLAKKAISYDLDEREFQCFTIPVEKKKLRQFKNMIRAFRAHMVEESAFQGDEVYQVNLQFFPLTQFSQSIEEPQHTAPVGASQL